MPVTPPPTDKKYFTHEEANKTLPLVKAIVRDITKMAYSMRERLEKMHDESTSTREEIEATLEQDQEQMQALVDELTGLGVEIKDFFTGLVDFPCWSNGREIYLCWKLDEPTIGYWHEIEAGFAGRKKLS